MKIKFTPVSLLVCLLIVTALSCDETTIVKNYTGTGEEKTYSIEGYAQKGPFIIGTDVTVSELSEDLYPTGRVFFATILNDEGYFELPGVVLTSQYVQIKVRGRYFSEIGGYVPEQELTLYSLADVTNSETINVNILTHLEKERVEYLVQKENKSFYEAKAQAQAEILEVFEWENLSVNESEHLNISGDDTGAAVLLAMSSLFDAIDFVTRLETITNFKVDFAPDGVLNSATIQNKLLTAAAVLNTSLIRHNMETKYETVMPEFEEALEEFIDNSPYTNYLNVVFPKTHDGHLNLFRANPQEINSSTNYAFIIAPFPENINVGTLQNTATFEAYFLAPDNTYPENFTNNFLVGDNDQLKIPYYDQSQILCNPAQEGGPMCWQVIARGGLQSVPVTSLILVPATFIGDGTLNVQVTIDIDDTIFTYETRVFTW